jgi:hypothetical protein
VIIAINKTNRKKNIIKNIAKDKKKNLFDNKKAKKNKK